MHPGKKRAILVLGMHRSGTSAVAGAAHLLGAEPPKFMVPAAADNPSGFFEAITVLGVNDWILRAGGSTWFDCLNFGPDSLPPRSRDTGQALVNFSLIGEFENASLLLLKDPRLCLLLDYWLPVLRGTSITPAALLVLRDPHEVVASLMQRDHCPAAFTAALWLRYMFAAEHATRDCSRSFIRYEALLGDWRTCVARAAAQAEVQWRVGFDAVATQMQRFLDVGLRHHRSAAVPPAPPGTLAALMEDAYRALLAIAEDDGDTQRGRLDRLRATFTAWCRRDGASFAARALEGHELLRQPAQAIPPGWEELAETLALKTRGQPGPV
jgi:hypothetical protein